MFKNLDRMPFVMERFTGFSSQIEFLPSLELSLYLQLLTYPPSILG